MKRGFRFRNLNKIGNELYQILSEIDIEKYFWHIEDSEIWKIDKNSCIDNLFIDKFLDGENFLTLIRENRYNIISCKILGAKIAIDTVNIYEEINTYNDFIKSDFEILLLIVDSVYVDIYLKNNQLLEKLYKKSTMKKYLSLEYIDSLDSRIRMNTF